MCSNRQVELISLELVSLTRACTAAIEVIGFLIDELEMLFKNTCNSENAK